MKRLAFSLALFAALNVHLLASSAPFTGLVEAKITGLATPNGSVSYLIGSEITRVEFQHVTDPHPVIQLVNRASGEITLIMPQSSLYQRIPPQDEPEETAARSAPESDFTETGETKPHLDLTGQELQLEIRGQTLTTLVTEKLPAYQHYLPPHALPFGRGPVTLEQAWADALIARSVFPLQAEIPSALETPSFRFEVTAITPQPAEEIDPALFLPPAEYEETPPLLPFKR